MKRGRHLLLACLIATLAGLGGCVDYPPQHYVCLSCEEGIEAADEPSNLTVTSSELRIQIRSDGNARWQVNSTLEGSGVEKLRADPARVDRLASRAVTDEVGSTAIDVAIHGNDTTDLSARLDGQTLRLSFIVRDFAKPGLGDTMIVDTFHYGGGELRPYSLGADRVEMMSSGKVVVVPPERASVSDDRRQVIWTGKAQYVEPTSYIAFGSSSDVSDTLPARLEIINRTVRWALPMALLVWLLLGALGTVVLFWLGNRTIGRPPLVSVGTGSTVGERVRDRPPIALVSVVFALAAALVAILANVQRVVDLTLKFSFSIPVIPLALLFVLGCVLDRYPRIERSVSVALLGLPLVTATAFYVGTWPKDLTLAFYGDVFVRWPNFALAVVGIPLFYLGFYFNSRSGDPV